MKKVYFLIGALVAFLMSNLSSNFFVAPNQVASIQKNDIASDNYLALSYQGGNFYSWNQGENLNQHIIGIFTNDNDQSYLLDNFGVFWSLDVQILNFVRINDETGIAQIKYFQDQNKKEYFNQNFFVQLNNTKITINNEPIMAKNLNFAVLNQEYVLAFGIGLELIKISDQSVKVLIPPYDKGNFVTAFNRINDNEGIFVAGDQYFYLLKDIIGDFSQTKINLQAPVKNTNNVVVINNNNVVIRDKENKLYFLDLSGNIVINAWNEKSNAKNIAFALTEETFILNVSTENSGFEYGIPYLVKISNWQEKKKIPNIKTINDFMFINGTNGIVLDKDLLASMFSYQSSTNEFTLSYFGSINSFQFVNKNLLFGSLNDTNLLLTQESRQEWAAANSIKFSSDNSQGNGNLLNNVIQTQDSEINYQNTYFSDRPANISVTNDKLVDVVVESSAGKRIIKPKQNNVTYTFSDFNDYHVAVNFFSNDVAFTLNYQVRITNFTNQTLLNISGENLITYVGYANNGLEEKLYDIKSIDQKDSFTIDKYNYNYLQYVELVVYDDTEHMVVQNVYNLKDNSKLAVGNEENDIFFGLKIVNLLNQVTWIYLGFSNAGIKPMIDFWDTDFGKNLMQEALARRYLEQDLRKMNSEQIQELIKIANTWVAIAIQGKAIVISVIVIFFFALTGILFAGSYKIVLDKQIEIQEVEKNKRLKNPLDIQ